MRVDRLANQEMARCLASLDDYWLIISLTFNDRPLIGCSFKADSFLYWNPFICTTFNSSIYISTSL